MRRVYHEVYYLYLLLAHRRKRHGSYVASEFIEGLQVYCAQDYLERLLGMPHLFSEERLEYIEIFVSNA